MEQLTQLFIEAGTLMLSGMVFVFVFLGLLVVIIKKILSPLADRFPDPVVSSPTKSIKKTSVNINKGVAPDVVAAISTAVAQYRQKHNE